MSRGGHRVGARFTEGDRAEHAAFSLPCFLTCKTGVITVTTVIKLCYSDYCNETMLHEMISHRHSLRGWERRSTSAAARTAVTAAAAVPPRTATHPRAEPGLSQLPQGRPRGHTRRQVPPRSASRCIPGSAETQREGDQVSLGARSSLGHSGVIPSPLGRALGCQ